jgi:CRP/FNR family transcriptional regulator, cyclic AMP receptor protein
MDQPISLDLIVSFLVSTPFFDGLDAAERAEVVRILEVRRLTEGEEVFHEGEAGDAWYIVYEGRTRVVQQLGGSMSEVAVLAPGACFGEMSILDGGARSATIEAIGPTTLFRFRRARFQGLLDQGSLGAYKLVLAMARMLSRRDRELTAQISELSLQRMPVSASGVNWRLAGEAATRYQVSE